MEDCLKQDVKGNNMTIMDSPVPTELDAKECNDSHENIKEMSSEDEEAESFTRKRAKKLIKHFSDSDDSESNKENSINIKNLEVIDNGTVSSSTLNIDIDNESEEEIRISKTNVKKSRIKNISNICDSSESEHEVIEHASKNKEQQLRMKNKMNKLKNKFQSLITSREHDDKSVKPVVPHGKSVLTDDDNSSDSSAGSNDESSSIHQIKKKISSYKTTICDPDTSDEENNTQIKSMPQKKAGRSIKLTSPKPIRMTAKQAMENMKKIKSESNRMLREKEVSLPYHRPKALSLKDIMSRRKPAVSSDGKTLPIKMNEEQLKQYVRLLEERQKEMMELCKSDTEEEEEREENIVIPDNGQTKDNFASNNDKIKEDLTQNRENDNNIDLIYDEIVIEANYAKKRIAKGDEKIDETASLHNSSNEKAEDTSNTEILLCNDDTNDKPENISNTEMNLVYDDSVNNKPENSSNTEMNLVNDSINDEPDNAFSNTNINLACNDCMKEKPENTSNTEMKLLYNCSIEESIFVTPNVAKTSNDIVENMSVDKVDEITTEIELKSGIEADSQLVSLHYDTAQTNAPTNEMNEPCLATSKEDSVLENIQIRKENKIDDFSDDDINLEEIDNLIENAEILKDENCDSPMLVKNISLSIKPKLTGTPGMIIDLDGTSVTSRKLSGVELLKERFTYFAKLKTPEELEKDKERRIKPGTQHLKLKQELEEKIAEQRSLDWAKRLEQEKQQQLESNAIRGDASDDDIEKIEAKLEDKIEDAKEVSSDNETEEEEEEEIAEKEKPRKRNPMIDDEAEESDTEECEKAHHVRNGDVDENEAEFNESDTGADNEDASDEDSSDDESSESEIETEAKPKKGRILKAFEDSDDENTSNEPNKDDDVPILTVNNKDNAAQEHMAEKECLQSQAILESQDDDLQLAQRHKSFSDDLFTSQESALLESSNKKSNKNENTDEPDLGTQTFSILNNDISEAASAVLGNFPERLDVINKTQHSDEVSLDAVVGMCSGSFSQSLVTSQYPSAPTQSLPIGDDILNLCTGKFYDNVFVSQMNDDINVGDKTSQSFNKEIQASDIVDSKNIDDAKVLNSEEEHGLNIIDENIKTIVSNSVLEEQQHEIVDENRKSKDGNVLESILEELNDPEFEAPKPNKYFVGAQNTNNKQQSNTQFKKKFIIDSDDETNEAIEGTETFKKKIKKRKPEKRALQISDDEGDECSEEDEELESMSDVEEDAERIVEYDSEENEVEVQPIKANKKKKLAEFLEQEAELTSEDEWVGSGDEDEASLDCMEREAGDDDKFNQAKLQRELGQIHMRDVLDQDKREVRIIQELLFEDGDLGDGHRQRKFRWRNADGEEITGTVPDEFADTQEEEFESEEQWRKQRHEREVFLRQMQKQDDEDASFNVSINRTSIIKANLSSRTMSSLLSDAKKTTTETETLVIPEKKISKDIPSPKKAFTVFQQNYHGSILSRGGGALARLAALATPLAVDDDDAPKIGSLAPSSKRNFVFAALTPEEKPKVAKRKAETNVGTPRLIKKMRTKENQVSKYSLLDHLKT